MHIFSFNSWARIQIIYFQNLIESANNWISVLFGNWHQGWNVLIWSLSHMEVQTPSETFILHDWILWRDLSVNLHATHHMQVLRLSLLLLFLLLLCLFPITLLLFFIWAAAAAVWVWIAAGVTAAWIWINWYETRMDVISNLIYLRMSHLSLLSWHLPLEFQSSSSSP